MFADLASPAAGGTPSLLRRAWRGLTSLVARTVRPRRRAADTTTTARKPRAVAKACQAGRICPLGIRCPGPEKCPGHAVKAALDANRRPRRRPITYHDLLAQKPFLLRTTSDLALKPVNLFPLRRPRPEYVDWEELAKLPLEEVIDIGYDGGFLAAYMHWLWDYIHGWHHPGAPRGPLASALAEVRFTVALAPSPSPHWAAPGWRPPAQASPLLN